MHAQKNFLLNLIIIFCLFFFDSPTYAAKPPKSAKAPKAAQAPKSAPCLFLFPSPTHAAEAPKSAKAPKGAQAPKSAPTHVVEVPKSAKEPKATEAPKSAPTHAAEAPKSAKEPKATEAPKSAPTHAAEAPKSVKEPKATKAPESAPTHAAKASKSAKESEATSSPKSIPSHAAESPESTKEPSAIETPKSAPKSVPKKEKYGLAIDFCGKRRTSDARNFCLEILKSDPKIASAKDYSTLLKIATNAALDNAKKIIDSLDKKLNIKTTKPAIKSVLKDCIDIYRVVVNEYLAIIKKLKSSFVESDAHVANDEIRGCQGLLVSRKISEPFISNRNRIAEEYGVLVEDIANLI